MAPNAKQLKKLSHISLLVIILILSLIIVDNTERFEVDGPELVTNGNFGQKLDSWVVSHGEVIWSSAETTSSLKLRNHDAAKIASLGQEIRAATGYDWLEVKARIAIEEVGYGDNPWNAARVILVAIAEGGTRIYDVPHVLYSGNGSEDWTEYKRRIFTTPQAVTYHLEIQLVNVEGEIAVETLSVRPIKTLTSYSLLLGCTAALWILLVTRFLSTSVYINGRTSSWSEVLFILAFLTAILGAMLPLDVKYHALNSFRHMSSSSFDDESVYQALHYLVYLALSFFLVLRWLGKLHGLVLLVIAVLVATLTELTQFMVDGRTPRIFDVWVNVSGVLTGFFLAYCLKCLERCKLAGVYFQNSVGRKPRSRDKDIA
jgi:VanZ family protein